MVGSIDPRCETVRGTHWPKEGRVVVWSSRRGNHLGQRSIAIASTGRTYGCKRSDQTVQKTLVARGPSTYGSLLSQGQLSRGSPLAERAHQLVVQRLDQVGQHGAVAGLHEGFDRFFFNDTATTE